MENEVEGVRQASREGNTIYKCKGDRVWRQDCFIGGDVKKFW